MEHLDGRAAHKRTRSRKGMTRRQQTAWIVGAMVVLALFVLDYSQKHDSADPYARCHGIFSGDSTTCEASVAYERLSHH